jgi:hypothetical protein
MPGREFVVVAICYAAGALFTFGKFYREYEKLSHRHVVYALAWPLWWPISQGLGAMLDAVGNVAWGTDTRAWFSFAAGFFTAGYYLTANWSSCSGAVECAGVMMKATALTVAPASLVYWGWLVFG